MISEDAQTAFLAAIDAADPTKLVTRAVRTGALDDWFESREYPKQIHVIALGKAAPRMTWGLIEANVPFTGIGVTTKGQKMPSLEKFWHVGGHPIPDVASFAAGDAVFAMVDKLPADSNVLVLLSGGASACVDVADNPEQVMAAHQELLASGKPIDVINRERAAISKFKAGGLGRKLLAAGANVRVWALNDVAPGQERIVGSGPCDLPEIDHAVVGDYRRALAGASEMLAALGYSVETRPRLAVDATAELKQFLDPPLAGKSARIAAGEPTLAIPANAPKGGRCHHVALQAAGKLPPGAVFFAGGTDGQDGTTGAAGAWTQAGDENPGALGAFSAYEHLRKIGRSLNIGATGTNVNDLWVVLQE